MNYLPRNRTRNNHYRILLFLVGVFGVGALTFFFLNGVALSVISPLWQKESSLTRSLSGIGGYFRTRASLITESESLRARVASLEAELSNRSTLSQEESAILLNFGREGAEGGIAAAVLARPPRTPYDLLVIDAGSNQGVSTGMEVSLPEGPLLGLVSEVYGRSAKVRLLSAPGELTPAVLERSGLSVELEGHGGGTFVVKVPRDEVVEVGDRILSADLSGRFLGAVEEVKGSPTDSFKEIFARSAENIFNVRFVVVR